MKICKFSIIFILTTISLQIFGQEIKISRKISWQGVKELKMSEEEKVSFLAFDHSINDASFGNLPMFFERIAVQPNVYVSKVSIVNPVFKELTSDEMKRISDIIVIKNEVVVKSDVYYEREKPYAHILLLPFRKNITTGKVERLESFELSIIPESKAPIKKRQTATKSSSVLSSGHWFKIGVKSSGIYKITYADLVKLNVDVSSLNPANIAVFGNGGGMLPELNSDVRYDDLQENAIQVVDGNDGSFDPQDYILFYAKGPNTWTYDSLAKGFSHSLNLYSDYSAYFINIDPGIGLKKRIQPQQSLTSVPDFNISTFQDYAFWERDIENLINSGKLWFGEKFDLVTAYNFPFIFQDINMASKAHVKLNFAARSTVLSTFSTATSNTAITTSVSPVSASYTDYYAYTAQDTFSFFPTSSLINLNISYSKPLSSSTGWLDYIEVNVLRNLAYSGQQMAFRNYNPSMIGGKCQYTMTNANSNVKIWDVSDMFNVKSQEFSISGNALTFNLLMEKPQEFVAFNGSMYNSVETLGKVENQNLHAAKDYDMVIVTDPLFISESQQLANMHQQQQNLSVLIVTPNQIFNEYSSGAQDITAIRDFLRQLYSNSSTAKKLKYVLLFGDGSYDPKNRIPNNSNLIPAYEANNSLHPALSFVTDDYYGLFDDNEGPDATGSLDVGIGRIPVSTKTEAQGVVNKILRYTSNTDLSYQSASCSNYASLISNFGDWRNVVCFVADDEDGNLHITDADNLATFVKTNNKQLNIDKIYFDAYKQESTPGGQRYPDVTYAINQRVTKGALFMNYTGHGGELGWAHERVLEIADINRWSNKNNCPIFITATCEFSRFDNPQLQTAGELVLLNPEGGGISLLTTTRLAYSNSNFSLNLSLYKFLFKKDLDGKYLALSTAMYQAKNDNGNNLYIRNFVLLGDPAVVPAYPKQKVVTTLVNAHAANLLNDTLKALSKVTVSGAIQDENGNKITDFNGTVYPQVFDKSLNITTLANDPGSSYPFTFTLQKNVLYKGKAKVVNGDFTFSFIVPKDIAYQFGLGKISYYAKNDAYDATGYYEQIVIGGVDTNQTIDAAGPRIKMYLNNSKFAQGGETNENPLLIIDVSDSGGVNTVGNGIGHDITAVLDNVSSKPFVLNDYYEADMDSYQKGFIRYPFYNLAEGPHNLKVKVWDVYNNSSETYLDFIVATSSELALKHVLNYPNPFTTSTSFYFEHNQPCCFLEVQIQIFTISGKIVKNIQTTITTDGYRNEPIPWDGKDDFGDNLGRGVYIYKVKVKNPDGKYAEKLEKLVILK